MAGSDTIPAERTSGWGAKVTDDAPAVMTAQQVADMLQIDRRTLERLIARGEGPPSVRFGRSRRWLRSDVEQWLRDHREDR